MALFQFSFGSFLLMPANGLHVDTFKPERGQKAGIADTPGRPGAFIGPAYPMNVKVSVGGTLIGSSWDDFEAKRDALLAALFTTGTAPLRRRDDRSRLAVMTGAGGLEDEGKEGSLIAARRFELAFEGEPFEREDVMQVAALPGAGSATIPAGGNAPALPSLTFVISAVSGEASLTFANAQGTSFAFWPPAADTYTIDALTETVTDGSGADMTAYLDCKFPVLMPGGNDWTVGSTGPGSIAITGDIPITWQSRWY